MKKLCIDVVNFCPLMVISRIREFFRRFSNPANERPSTPAIDSGVANNLSDKQVPIAPDSSPAQPQPSPTVDVMTAGSRTDTAPAELPRTELPSVETPAVQPPSPQPTATVPLSTPIAASSPVYEWNPASGFASAKAALQIKTSLPDGSSIIGYPALSNPDAELPLYQVQPSGDPFDQKDLARLLPPGEIAVLACGYYPDIHENEIPHKRNMGHACLAVGVEREILVNGQPRKEQGVMTINNPQTYLGGGFQGGGYGCFFVQALQFPAGLSSEEITAYKKNIVTMTALANTYIPFAQENFNGSDPLGIHNREKIQEAGEKLLLAVYGDAEAQQWLRESRNTAYCAELVSVGINTGTATVLTQAFIEQLHQKLIAQHGTDRYPNFYGVIHDRITSKQFLQQNDNQNLSYVTLGMVEEGIDLQPIHQRCPEATQSANGLAFMYYDFADIAYGSIRDTYPRRDLTGLAASELSAARAYNAKVAKVRVAAFKEIAANFKRLANLDPQTTVAFDRYVSEEVIPGLEKDYASEPEHDHTFAQLLQKGKAFTPTGPDGDGMFIPPDLYLMPNQTQQKGWAGLNNIGIAFFPDNLRPIVAN